MIVESSEDLLVLCRICEKKVIVKTLTFRQMPL